MKGKHRFSKFQLRQQRTKLFTRLLRERYQTILPNFQREGLEALREAGLSAPVANWLGFYLPLSASIPSLIPVGAEDGIAYEATLRADYESKCIGRFKKARF